MPIPDVNEYRPVTNQADIERWFSQMRDEIGKHIEKSGDWLRNGGELHFAPAPLRDGGESQRLWEKHYQTLVMELRENGWHVTSHLDMRILSHYLMIASVKKGEDNVTNP